MNVRVIEDNLRKITEELADNAFKFSEPGTEVRVSGAFSGGSFTISVTNCGRGMTAQQIASIGPHVQFERETYEQQGAGLGLIIARMTYLLSDRLVRKAVTFMGIIIIVMR